MAKHTPEDIKAQISVIKDLSDENLIHFFKIVSSKHTASDKKLYEPLKKAIEKERRRRGSTSTVSSIVKPKAPVPKKEGLANPDDY